MVKGPLTVTDIVCWHVGMGMGLYGVKPLRLADENRRRIPGFFHRDELNVPDVMQRVHWDPAFARRSGNPTTFDYGRMRETWLIHLCTDWMGDDAWLWKLDCEFRLFNYVGDTQWLEGTIVKKYLADGERPAVELELRVRQPTGADDHARPRHRSAAQPGARAGSPAGATGRGHGASRRPGGSGRQVLPELGRLVTPEPYEGRPGLAVRRSGGVLSVELDRPEKRNALTDEMVAAFIAALDAAGQDEAVRAIVVRSAGDHFCSGFDIVGRNADPPARGRGPAASSGDCRPRPTD